MQWLENHHNRKQQPGQARTNTIEDVYGSRWLSAGTGSVLSMWVEAEGSTLINIRQVKSPSDVLPHLKVEVDKRQGLMIQQAETVSPITFIRSFGPAGVSAKEFATYYGKSENAARNELNALVGLDQLEVAPTTGRSENGKPVAKRWRTVLGVIPQKVQNIYQQDGLGDF